MNERNWSTIVVTDCGSTTTKAILLQLIDGDWQQTHRAEAPTTVEAPEEDVTVGVSEALQKLSVMCGKKLVDAGGHVNNRNGESGGCDLYLSSSSAGGGLQMLVIGLVGRISVESAQKAALGAGAIVADVIAYDDDISTSEQVERIRDLRPDMVLFAGGADDGATVPVLELAERLATARPRPRFGESFQLPVIFAGNRALGQEVAEILGDHCQLCQVSNVRPQIERENLRPARGQVHEIFLTHVMRQAPGFSRLTEWTDGPIMPTPLAAGEMLSAYAKRRRINALSVDIGGATTDVFSVIDGQFNRTVSANLGVSYSAANVLQHCGVAALRGWLPVDVAAGEVYNAVMNKTIRPTRLPQGQQNLWIEQALAREALSASFAQHRDFNTGLKGGGQEINADAAFAQPGAVGWGPMTLDLIIGSGGVLSHAPRIGQTAAMLIDAFLPEGVTRLAKDAVFMMPHLGVLNTVLPETATTVFERDCLLTLGTCVAPVGREKTGRIAVRYEIHHDHAAVERGEWPWGDIQRLPLAPGAEVAITLTPSRRLDVGAGRGKVWRGRVAGGPLGVIFDGRGRPLRPRADGPATMEAWFRALGAWDEAEAEG